jgi:histidinol-phosphate/aromatic aminotransferase/cobyric acid decarboxylase-like protein
MAGYNWRLADPWVDGYVERVGRERLILTQWLERQGVRVWPSQANFVLTEWPDAAGVWRRLGQAGVAVRRFDADPSLARCLRITLPGSSEEFDRLQAALEASFPGPDRTLPNLPSLERPRP